MVKVKTNTPDDPGEKDLHGLTPNTGESPALFARRVVAAEREAYTPDPDAVPDDGSGVDPFAEIWGDADSDQVVMLRRISPVAMNDPNTGESISIKGYLEDLPPGITFSYVQKKHGGGLYYIQRREGNKFKGLKKIEISGPPRCPGGAGAGVSAVASSLPGGGAEFEGVPVAGSNLEWEQTLSRLMATKKILSDDNQSVNTELMKMLLDSRGPSLTELIGTMGTVINGVREMVPNGDNSGAGLMDIGVKLLDTVQTLVNKKSAAPVRPGRVITGKPIALPDNSTVQNAESEEVETMAPKTDVRQVASVAISNLIAGFQLDPPKEPARMVSMLDNILGLDKETRGGLKDYRDQLFDMAEVQLSDYFIDLPEKRAEFSTYFELVFSMFVDLEREVKTL